MKLHLMLDFLDLYPKGYKPDHATDKEKVHVAISTCQEAPTYLTISWKTSLTSFTGLIIIPLKIAKY